MAVHDGVENTPSSSLAVSLAAIVALVFVVVRRDGGDTRTEAEEGVPHSVSTTGRVSLFLAVVNLPLRFFYRHYQEIFFTP